ncbi:hypothetical protein YC2023_066854 [Brassica napus]
MKRMTLKARKVLAMTWNWSMRILNRSRALSTGYMKCSLCGAVALGTKRQSPRFFSPHAFSNQDVIIYVGSIELNYSSGSLLLFLYEEGL